MFLYEKISLQAATVSGAGAAYRLLILPDIFYFLSILSTYSMM